MSTRQVFEYQTIAELAKQLKANQAHQQANQVVVGEQPLLPIQQAFLSGDTVDLHHFNQAMRITLPASVNETQLRKAIQAIYQRHAVFRLSFQQLSQGHHEAKQQWQGLYEDKLSEQAIQQSFHIVNSDTEWDTLAYKAQTSLQLSAAPLSLLVWKPAPPTENADSELLWVIHHLIVDGVSWRILLQDLEYALNQLQQGKPIDLGLGTSSFQQWGLRLIKYSQSEALTQEKAYWQQVLSQHVSVLPVDQPLNSGVDDTYQASGEVTVSLSSATTQALLHQANQSYHTQINDLLLTALLLTITDWNRGQAIRLELEGHGREALFAEVDLNETVGWFTSTYPVTLNRNTDELGTLIKYVKEQLRAIPNKGIGYGVLRYFNDDQQDLVPATPIELVFNYLGQFDSHTGQESPSSSSQAGMVLEGSFDNTGPWVSHRRQRSHRLSISGLVSEGKLQLVWDYNRYQYNASTIQDLADNFFKHLTTIVEHCLASPSVYTPSDFPLAQIDSKQLDQLQGAYPQLTDLYPCTPMQQGMLFHSKMQPESGVYVTQLILSFGAINPDHLQQSWQQLVARHAILRTAFVHLDQAQPLQLVQREVELPWQQVDCRALSAEGYQKEWASLLRSEREALVALDHAPLMRLALVQQADEQYHLIWTHHHALLDGWGVPILIQDLEALYCAHQQGQPAQLSPVVPYRQYIQWLQQQSAESARVFWQDYLAGFTEPSPLVMTPVKRFVDGQDQPLEKEYQFALSPALSSQLQQLAKHAQVTLSTVFQGAWGMLLSRYCATTDVVFGVTRSGRPETIAGIEEMVGLFINSVPLRVQFDATKQLGDWLQALQQSQVNHDRFSYALLADIQQWSELPPNSQLFDTLLVVENFPMEEKLKQLNGESDATRLPLTELEGIEQSSLPLSITITPGESCHVRVLYQQAQFDDAAVRRLSEQWQQLLTTMVSSTQTLASLNALSASERYQLLVEYNKTEAVYPKEASLHSLFEDQVQRTPDAIAVQFEQASLTYKQLNQQANQLAVILQGYGVGPDSLVGVYLERSLEMVVGLFAILKAGGAYVPLDPSYPQERIDYMLSDSNPKAILTTCALQSRLLTDTQVICVDDMTIRQLLQKSDPTIENPIIEGFTSNNLAYVIYTSGSTGKPKGVMNEHQGVVNRILWMQKQLGPLTCKDKILQKTPFSFDVSVWEFFWPLMTGAKLVMALPDGHKDVDYLLNIINSEQITVIHFVPAMLAVFMADSRYKEETLSLKSVICSGEALPAKLANEFTSSHPAALYNLYGPTEAAIDVSWHRCQQNLNYHSVPIGKPIDNIQLYILNDQQQPVPSGIVGELYIGGDGVARGYLNQPNLTAERFIDNPFNDNPDSKSCLYRTGDLARWLSNGEIEYIGRIDHQVKIRGFRIELGEIESILVSHPSVKRAVVCVNEDGFGDKKLVAYIVPDSMFDGSEEHLFSALGSLLKSRLPIYMIPAAWALISAIPTSPNGKVDRKQLPKISWSNKNEQAYITNDLEFQLVKIWKKLLDIKQPIGNQDDFFQLGGHSLKVVQLVSQIQHELSIKVSLQSIYDYPTIQSLACHLNQLNNEGVSKTNQTVVELTPRIASKKTVYCFPGVGSANLDFRPLASCLENDINLKLIDSSDFLKEHADSNDWTSLVNFYLENLPDDSEYYLVGHSFGGCIANEVAAALERKNKKVYLVLLDTLLGLSILNDNSDEVLSIDQFVTALGMASFFDWEEQQVKDTITNLENPTELLRTTFSNNQFSDEFADNFIQLSKLQMGFFANYQPSKLNTTQVAFLYTVESFPDDQFLHKVVSCYKTIYSHLARSTRVDGGHLTMLKTAFVSATATEIKGFLPIF
ncbi:amino acid adenylation domain-containing protein [Zooshikella marina]|uniref:non-ribosomal peptide synthetase n=1 Tax=Zooshikella ganghwensis TaxID=202772 RepID=UPI001C03E079|nr:non-ribosomal peptide synthetase [Zooshikella ganghwensis]MBU2708896.1 amino acid adenylation domain-containing protein [Zooshikella ganghwensis]